MTSRSKVEISGRWARWYDLMMDVLLLGRYGRFMRQVLDGMELEPGEAILDLGSGTGRNACLLAERVGPEGRVVGLDISDQMLARARRRCAGRPQVSFVKQRIEQSLPFTAEFDRVFLSFVLHGFEDDDKRRILANAYQALKPGGSIWILDYNEFDLSRLPGPLRWGFRWFECELAIEFLALDLQQMLAEVGFGDFVSKELTRGYLRLLGAWKK